MRVRVRVSVGVAVGVGARVRVRVKVRGRGRVRVRVRVRIARQHMKKRAPATPPPWQLVRPLMLPMMARKISGGMTSSGVSTSSLAGTYE